MSKVDAIKATLEESEKLEKQHEHEASAKQEADPLIHAHMHTRTHACTHTRVHAHTRARTHA